jgi:hypothetical protein
VTHPLADPAGYHPAMRSVVLLSLAAAFVLGVSVIPAGAGDLPIQPIHVTKVVEGPVPEGTEFEIVVECEGVQGPTVSETLTFPATGGNQVVGGGGPSHDCTINETVTGGATTVAYDCVPFENVTCDPSGQAFSFSSDFAEVEITVTNTFVPPEPPAAEPLVVGPAFTG